MGVLLASKPVPELGEPFFAFVVPAWKGAELGLERTDCFLRSAQRNAGHRKRISGLASPFLRSAQGVFGVLECRWFLQSKIVHLAFKGLTQTFDMVGKRLCSRSVFVRGGSLYFYLPAGELRIVQQLSTLGILFFGVAHGPDTGFLQCLP